MSRYFINWHAIQRFRHGGGGDGKDKLGGLRRPRWAASGTATGAGAASPAMSPSRDRGASAATAAAAAAATAPIPIPSLAPPTPSPSRGGAAGTRGNEDDDALEEEDDEGGLEYGTPCGKLSRPLLFPPLPLGDASGGKPVPPQTDPAYAVPGGGSGTAGGGGGVDSRTDATRAAAAVARSERRKKIVRAIAAKAAAAEQRWWREALHDFHARRQWMCLPPPSDCLRARPYFDRVHQVYALSLSSLSSCFLPFFWMPMLTPRRHGLCIVPPFPRLLPSPSD